MTTPDEIEGILEEALSRTAAADTLQEIDAVRVGYLGRQGRLKAEMKRVGKLPPTERPEAGRRVNEASTTLREALDDAERRSARIWPAPGWRRNAST